MLAIRETDEGWHEIGETLRAKPLRVRVVGDGSLEMGVSDREGGAWRTAHPADVEWLVTVADAIDRASDRAREAGLAVLPRHEATAVQELEPLEAGDAKPFTWTITAGELRKWLTSVPDDLPVFTRDDDKGLQAVFAAGLDKETHIKAGQKEYRGPSVTLE